MSAGTALAEAASDAAATSSSGNLKSVVQSDLERSGAWSQSVGSSLSAVVLPGAAGSGKTCAAAKQQLLQLQGCLQQELDAARKLLNSAIAGSSSDDSSLQLVVSALSSIMQQRNGLAEALCAQFPLPYCCNNPGCTELHGASELQLVGGKGCVCARCRCARATINTWHTAMLCRCVRAAHGI
jgi:hypothetical protein